MSFPKKPTRKRTVYLDHAAATPVDAVVLRAMQPFAGKQFANPSALYASGLAARQAVEESRALIADTLATQPDTIIFTGSGTESTNLAILGLAKFLRPSALSLPPIPGHIISTVIEHHAVLHPIQQLEKEGWAVTYLPVDKAGQVNVDDFKKALRPDTKLVSIMYANNEIGTILPVAEIGREILKWRKEKRTAYPYFHTDACQAAGYLDLQVERLHVDLMSVNASKIYGPKGAGFLYKRRGIVIEPIIYGGGQEWGMRSGTENVAGIVGMAKALVQAKKNEAKTNKTLTAIRNYFWKEIKRNIPDIRLNGVTLDAGPSFAAKTEIARLPNNLNVVFSGVDAEALIIYLDAYGIVCSSGSACTTDSDEVSHVLLACGVPAEAARSSIRFTLGKMTTKKDVQDVMKYLPAIVKELRQTREGGEGM